MYNLMGVPINIIRVFTMYAMVCKRSKGKKYHENARGVRPLGHRICHMVNATCRARTWGFLIFFIDFPTRLFIQLALKLKRPEKKIKIRDHRRRRHIGPFPF